MSNKKKRLVLISSLFAVLATASAVLFAGPAPKEKTDGKFHVVYFVTAVDLKPGSKVTADPIFFTDGKEVINFHDHCEPKYRELKDSQIAGDHRLIKDYCARKTFAVSFKNHHVLNNYGQSLSLEPALFQVIDTQPLGMPSEPPGPDGKLRGPGQFGYEYVMLGRTTAKAYTPGTLDPPANWLRRDGTPEHFFLMSDSKAILEKIVPVYRATKAEVDVLVKRVEAFKQVAKWRRGGDMVRERDLGKSPYCYDAETPAIFRLQNPLIADFDQDGKLDIYVDVLTVVDARLDVLPQYSQFMCSTSYSIFGNGDAYLLSGNTHPYEVNTYPNLKRPEGSLPSENPPYTARLLALRLPGKEGSCTYALDAGQMGINIWGTGGTQCEEYGRYRKLKGTGYEGEGR